MDDADPERWLVIDGRRWRRTDPSLPADLVDALTSHLGRARSAVRSAKAAGDDIQIADARARVGIAKRGLGERGPYWWDRPVADRVAQARRAVDELESLQGGMPVAAARAELEALCGRGMTWVPDPFLSRMVGPAARPAAVLVLFGVLDGVAAASSGPAAADLDVLLLRRAATLGSHAGQIAFPGGRLESGDAGPVEGALREAVEETGLDAAGVDVLGTLPPVPVPVSNHSVTPVVGWWTRPSEVAAIDHGESVDVFRVPVAELLLPANRGSTEHVWDGRTVRAPAFTVGGRVVWGFTALILSRMFDELGWTEAWRPDRIIERDDLRA